jgi:[ribosomal protein S5]-alanine N-acetyltransferase
MIEIETSRLHLRQLTPDDLDELHPIFSDMEVVKYLKTGEDVSREDTEEALRSIIRHWKQRGFGRWGAVLKETGKLIGYGGLRNLYGTPELVYLLAKPYWGMGLATEIGKACLKWGFEHQRFERIVAVTRHEHAASRRVMEKIGMVYERDETFHDINVVLYSISRSTHQSLSALEEFPFACVADNNSSPNHAKRIITTEA